MLDSSYTGTSLMGLSEKLESESKCWSLVLQICCVMENSEGDIPPK